MIIIDNKCIPSENSYRDTPLQSNSEIFHLDGGIFAALQIRFSVHWQIWFPQLTNLICFFSNVWSLSGNLANLKIWCNGKSDKINCNKNFPEKLKFCEEPTGPTGLGMLQWWNLKNVAVYNWLEKSGDDDEGQAMDRSAPNWSDKSKICCENFCSGVARRLGLESLTISNVLSIKLLEQFSLLLLLSKSISQ